MSSSRKNFNVAVGVAAAAATVIAMVYVNKPSATAETNDLDTPSVDTEVELRRSKSELEWTDLLTDDLSSWESWLGRPHLRNGQPMPDKEVWNRNNPVIGLGKDPDQVFTLIEEDGEKVLRISGEHCGGLHTKEEWKNYHFSAEYRWGKKAWPFQKGVRMDSGVLFHAHGKQGKQFGYWLSSVEYQLRPKTCGDVYFLGTRGTVPVSLERDGSRETYSYEYSKPDIEVRHHVKKKPGAQEKEGWNTIEVYAYKDQILFALNGKPGIKVNQLKNGEDQPLRGGRIQLQSRAAEIFFRRIRIRPIKKIPSQVVVGLL